MLPYGITLTASEVDSLCWLAGRYHYAKTLWTIMGGVDDDGTMHAELSEHQAWEFKEAVEEEDGFLPCCGGTLAAKMIKLLESIV